MSPEREQESWEQRWRHFESIDRLRDHWYWRPGWRVGRSFYTWHLTFDGAHELHRLVRDVQAALQVPGLDLVPLEGLHLTMQGVGFTDEVATSDIHAIVDAVAARCASVPPFSVTLGPLDPDEEGMGLLVSPLKPVTHLRTTVRAAMQTVWPDIPESEDFRPHVTVAYSNSDAPTEPVREQLAALRDLAPVTVPITAVQLIRLNRDAKVYRWEVHRTVDLGSAGTAKPGIRVG